MGRSEVDIVKRVYEFAREQWAAGPGGGGQRAAQLTRELWDPDLVPHDDRIVVDVHMVLRSKSGITLERDVAHVWRLRDGRVVHVTGYNDRAEALAAEGR